MQPVNRFQPTISILTATVIVLAIATPVAAGKPRPEAPDPALMISSEVPEGMPEGGATVTNTTLAGEIVSIQSDVLYSGETPETFAATASASGCNTCTPPSASSLTAGIRPSTAAGPAAPLQRCQLEPTSPIAMV